MQKSKNKKFFGLKKRRLELHLTLDDVAKSVNVSPTTVSRWENGKIKNMRRDKVVLLAEVLKVSPDVILELGEEYKTHFYEKRVDEIIQERNHLKEENKVLNEIVNKYLNTKNTDCLIILPHFIGEVVFFAPNDCRSQDDIKSLKIVRIEMFGKNCYKYVLETMGRANEQRSFYEDAFGKTLFTHYKDAAEELKRRILHTTTLNLKTGDIIMCDGKTLREANKWCLQKTRFGSEQCLKCPYKDTACYMVSGYVRDSAVSISVK